MGRNKKIIKIHFPGNRIAGGASDCPEPVSEQPPGKIFESRTEPAYR